jgi:hypothetical protein
VSQDVVAVVLESALVLRSLGRPLNVSFGVDNDLFDAVSVLPCAEIRQTVYSDSDSAYVIAVAKAQVGVVEVQAQARRRPATQAEIDSVAKWTEQVDQYRHGPVVRVA